MTDEATAAEPTEPSDHASAGHASADDADGVGDESPPDSAGPYSGRWSRLAGLVLLVYIVVLMARLALLWTDSELFRTATGWMASFGYRTFVAVVLVALLWHGFSGLRVVVLESSAAARRRPEWLSAAALFATIALAVPGCLLIFRPWIEGTLL